MQHKDRRGFLTLGVRTQQRAVADFTQLRPEMLGPMEISTDLGNSDDYHGQIAQRKASWILRNRPSPAKGENKSPRPYFDKFVSHPRSLSLSQLSARDIDQKRMLKDTTEETLDSDDENYVNYDWEQIHETESLDTVIKMTVSPYKYTGDSIEMKDVLYLTRSSSIPPLKVARTLLAGCYQLDAACLEERSNFPSIFFSDKSQLGVIPGTFQLGQTMTFTRSQLIHSTKLTLEQRLIRIEGRPITLSCGVYARPHASRPNLEVIAVAIYSAKKDVFISITINASDGCENDQSLLGIKRIVVLTRDGGLPIIEKTFEIIAAVSRTKLQKSIKITKKNHTSKLSKKLNNVPFKSGFFHSRYTCLSSPFHSSQ